MTELPQPVLAPPAPTPLSARAAIVHDWFQGFHGSERVVAQMLACFERPPAVYTFHAARELLPRPLAGAIVKESRIGRLPGVRQRGHEPGRWRWLLPYMPFYFRSLDLSGHDVVISSSHACAVGARAPRAALHLCYCYTPMRYAWMPATDQRRGNRIEEGGLKLARAALRSADRRAAQRPDAFIAISGAVAERIGRFYGRDAVVIHPPVAVDDLRPTTPPDPGHFLWVHRLVSYKRPLEVAAAFAGMPDLRLTMVGVGPLEAELRRMLPPNVELRGWVDRQELARLYEHAAGFIHVGEEDFGITMVEALAAGTPVIALAHGGALDIVRPDHDGLLVESGRSVDELRKAIRTLAERDWDPLELRLRAEQFSESVFRTRMIDLLREHGVA
jgi:glycosyltransferase involved in cell wall biosynthesis